MKKVNIKIAVMMCLFLFTVTSVAFADDAATQNQPYTYIFKFVVSGMNTTSASDLASGSPPVFLMSGVGYVPIITSDGQILDEKVPGLKKATLTNARITFTKSQSTDPTYVARFTCQYVNGTGCHITLPDGSELVASNDVVLDGRLVYGMDPATGQTSPWGFVPSPAFDPANGIFPQRILGCGGLKGVSGPLAGTVGSICFNGTFDVPMANGQLDLSKSLVGSSNCTITLHHPVNMFGQPVSSD